MRSAAKAMGVGVLVVASGIGAAGGGAASADSGIVKFYDVTKGFGFITPDDGGRDLGFRYTNLPQNIQQGQRVDYTQFPGPKGPMAAVFNVEGQNPVPRGAAAIGRKLPRNGDSRDPLR